MYVACARASRPIQRLVVGSVPADTQSVKAESERALSARVGRILFFLHHGVPAQGATDADLQLYDLLKS